MDIKTFVNIKNLKVSDYFKVFFKEPLLLFTLFFCFFLKKAVLKLRIFINTYRVDVKVTYINLILFFFKYCTVFQLNMLVDLFGVDYIYFKYRFIIIYNLLSINRVLRTSVGIYTTPLLSIPSVNKVFLNATWCERELWDMFGVYIKGQKDLRRILTDYNFLGHPLRKDFPVVGFMEVSYNYKKNCLFYHKVSLAQEMRISRASFLW